MKEFVRTILDYPVKGIQFRDITTLLQDAGHFKQVVDEMTDPWKDTPIDAVLSIESRGFIMAGAIAYNIDQLLFHSENLINFLGNFQSFLHPRIWVNRNAYT